MLKIVFCYFFKRMDEKQVAKILNQKYEGVPPDLISEFYKSLQEEKETTKQNPKKKKIDNKKENLPQENEVNPQKKKPKKGKKGKKKGQKAQKEKDLTPKNLCNFAIQDDITKFETEMKDLQAFANDLLTRFDNAISLFEEPQQTNEEEEEEEEIEEEDSK